MNTQSFQNTSIRCPYLRNAPWDPGSLYPPCIRYNDNLRRELMLLWAYLMSEDLWDDAFEYIECHADTPIPFSSLPMLP